MISVMTWLRIPIWTILAFKQFVVMYSHVMVQQTLILEGRLTIWFLTLIPKIVFGSHCMHLSMIIQTFLGISNVITIIVIAWKICVFVNIYHMISQFSSGYLCEITASRFYTINLVFGINCGPINFTYEQYFCIFSVHSKIFYLPHKFFWNIFISIFSFCLQALIFLLCRKLPR